MANTKDQVLEKPCIDYKCSFTHADFETVKLEQVYADGSKRTAKVPIFDGKFGMEGLLHVEDKFRKACNKLSYDTGRELFNGFEEVLADTAEDDENLMRQNRKRREHLFGIGQEVLIREVNPKKLQARAHGPYPIIQTWTNGTIDILRNPHVTERINIRRVIPYRRN